MTVVPKITNKLLVIISAERTQSYQWHIRKRTKTVRLNFLSNYLYETAGLSLPAYNDFGYYSKTRKAFIPYEEAEGKEAEILELYRILQYNSLFDKENRSQVFFPTAS